MPLPNPGKSTAWESTGFPPRTRSFLAAHARYQAFRYSPDDVSFYLKVIIHASSVGCQFPYYQNGHRREYEVLGGIDHAGLNTARIEARSAVRRAPRSAVSSVKRPRRRRPSQNTS